MMRHIRYLWHVGAAAALLCFFSVASSAPYFNDAVDDLREALRTTTITDSQNKDAIQYRKATLEKRIKALGIGDYRRALLLTEWRDNEKEEAVAAIDRPIREQLINDFVKKLRAILKNGTIPAKLAAITEIGEAGVAVRGTGTGSMASVFAPDLIAQMKEGESILRVAAARALGRINPDPQLAAKALGDLMANGTGPERTAAAEGLEWLLRSLVTLTRGGKNPITGIAVTRVEVTREEVTAMAAAVVPQAGRGLTDPDVPVRRFCLESLRLGSSLLTEQILEPRVGLPLAAGGRKLSKEEQEEVQGYRRQVEEERTLVMPLARALDNQAATLGRTLSDPVAEIRYLAAKALEDMGYARQRLDRKLSSVPAPSGSAGDKESRRPGPDRALVLVSANELVAQKDADKKDADKKDADKKEPEKPADPALQEDPLKPGLLSVMRLIAARFSDPNVRVRLAAADAIEPLGPLAAPVVPVIVRGLTDQDLFVRWATTRVLLRVGPVDTALTVPLLAPLLCDPDLDVRLTAATTLGSYGHAGLPAVPALAEAAVTGDSEQRIKSIEALTGIGAQATQAIPALVRALTAQDGRVRLAAAKALGIFGAAAGDDATKALERTLFDSDPVHGPAIRQAASDSLLTITSSK